jgi:hypothetical protein
MVIPTGTCRPVFPFFAPAKESGLHSGGIFFSDLLSSLDDCFPGGAHGEPSKNTPISRWVELQ